MAMFVSTAYLPVTRLYPLELLLDGLPHEFGVLGTDGSDKLSPMPRLPGGTQSAQHPQQRLSPRLGHISD